MSVATESPRHSASPSTPSHHPTVTFDERTRSRQPSSSINQSKSSQKSSDNAVGGVNGHGSSSTRTARPPKSSTPVNGKEGDETAWGSNFWVTLVDPQTQTSFFACPTTGQVSWDPPVGHFVLPPNEEGEWWELSDDSRGGIPYYYQTKTSETVWERPEGFVIPLGIVQNTALGRRLSQTAFNRFSHLSVNFSDTPSNKKMEGGPEPPPFRRSRSYANDQGDQTSQANGTSSKKQPASPARRSISSDTHLYHNGSNKHGPNLSPIPASPYTTDASAHSSPVSRKSTTSTPNKSILKAPEKEIPNGRLTPNGSARQNGSDSPPSRTRSKSSSYVSRRAPQPQSLHAAVELLSSSHSDSGHAPPRKSINGTSGEQKTNGKPKQPISPPTTPTKDKNQRDVPPSPRRPIPAVPKGKGAPGIAGRQISAPTLNHEATANMSPVKNRANGKPILVEPRLHSLSRIPTTGTLGTGTYPILPQDLASDIQQFSESEFARQYFSTHRTGFIFRRRVPVAQMMTWQKVPLNSPLLMVNRSLHKDAVKAFKVIQRIMGDRERDRAVGVRMPTDNHVSTVASINASATSLPGAVVGVTEEERWLLGDGLTHGELRDEIYCQLMKQLSGNPSPESVFKGWQLMCVLLITFPPSKNFETYLRSFMQQHTSDQEGRVDIMAKYGLRRLAFISKKGPRGKPPTVSEIEIASDAAFNPSTFGESLDAIIRLQERNYPTQKVPIILPFLGDGILALGGPKSEGIFRVPGDGDSVSELKLRIDQGYYTLDGVDDPHVLASLMKLWLRELCDPLVPEEMYNECISNAQDPEACVHIVQRLPTINRRVVLFVISFLQLFLEEKIQSVTKMTPANLALVMAPNLLRCNSESMSVVFTNSQYEQIFVYNLLLHLKCNEVDADYIPTHGLGAVASQPLPRVSKSRSRRPHH